MPKSVEICQFVTRTIKRTIWNIPRISDGSRWRDIENSYLVENPFRFFSHDRYEVAIRRTQWIMEKRGWNTELTGTQKQYHKHLIINMDDCFDDFDDGVDVRFDRQFRFG